MHTKKIEWMGYRKVLACDGKCNKAWGISNRPKLSLSDDPDDVAYLADGELGEAPKDPGTYEGCSAKPPSPAHMNKWCTRECERSDFSDSALAIKLPDWSKRCFNQPWKHHDECRAAAAIDSARSA